MGGSDAIPDSFEGLPGVLWDTGRRQLRETRPVGKSPPPAGRTRAVTYGSLAALASYLLVLPSPTENLNDIWKFDTGTLEWTWMRGSNAFANELPKRRAILAVFPGFMAHKAHHYLPSNVPGGRSVGAMEDRSRLDLSGCSVERVMIHPPRVGFSMTYGNSILLRTSEDVGQRKQHSF